MSPSSAPAVAPRFRKGDSRKSLGKQTTPPSTRNGDKQGNGHKSKNTELTTESTPPQTPSWGASDSVWDANCAEAALWNTSYRSAETDVWATDHCAAKVDDITTRVFFKIHSVSANLPHLTTKTRRSRNDNEQPLAEIAEAALKHAQKRDVVYGSDVFHPAVAGDMSILVQAAEGYKNALMAGKVSNVLERSEQAHLDIIIASKHWDSQLAAPEDAPTTSISLAPKPIANTPGQWNSPQQSSTKVWGQSDYMAWAKRNLTDATAIKLARTYCDRLQNGTAPMSLFGYMGKQAPPGTVFQYFSFLPYELREQIWLYALEDERNDVRLVWQRERRDDGHVTKTSFVNANQQQRFLFVNREIRGLALKHNYELAFRTRHSPAQTFFDFKRDRLFLHTRHSNEVPDLVKHIHRDDAIRIHTLAVPLRDFIMGNENRIAEALCRFKNVKRIHLVCGDGLEDKTYGGAGDLGLAKAIQRFFYNTWRKHNDPTSCPRFRMYTIPALAAKFLEIDNMRY